jgi:hypothetical protein
MYLDEDENARLLDHLAALAAPASRLGIDTPRLSSRPTAGRPRPPRCSWSAASSGDGHLPVSPRRSRHGPSGRAARSSSLPSAPHSHADARLQRLSRPAGRPRGTREPADARKGTTSRAGAQSRCACRRRPSGDRSTATTTARLAGRLVGARQFDQLRRAGQRRAHEPRLVPGAQANPPRRTNGLHPAVCALRRKSGPHHRPRPLSVASSPLAVLRPARR